MLQKILETANFVLAILFMLCYYYQLFLFVPVSWYSKWRGKWSDKKVAERHAKEPVYHNFAIMSAARNESVVIADLINSIKAQIYPQDKLTIFVIADNCTDNTAEIARESGAIVYTRQSKTEIGKGYALQALMQHIKEDYPEGFDGYFVFDADNVLEPDFIDQMNRTFCEGYDLLTSFRNSKNYGDNWISAGYGLWFLRDSRYVSQPRDTLRSSCSINGTGFLFSRKIADEMENGWPYHLLVEDTEFTIDEITKGRKVGYCRDAVLYDEQPVKFRQSWRQRMRWSRGYLQLIRDYGGRLFKGMFKGSFACYDMAMNFIPAYFLSNLSVIINIILLILGVVNGESFGSLLMESVKMIIGSCALLFILGVVTTITEWKSIHTTPAKKIWYTFTFPIFMLTYIPISFCALFKKTGWQPIVHTRSVASLGKDFPGKKA